jgi:hypothetical protein
MLSAYTAVNSALEGFNITQLPLNFHLTWLPLIFLNSASTINSVTVSNSAPTQHLRMTWHY